MYARVVSAWLSSRIQRSKYSRAQNAPRALPMAFALWAVNDFQEWTTFATGQPSTSAMSAWT